jgi:hypothetical protein
MPTSRGRRLVSGTAKHFGNFAAWASGHNGEIRRVAYGYEPTGEAAMAAFAKACDESLTDVR